MGKPTLEQAPGMTCGERSPQWSRLAGRTCDPVGGTQSVPEGLQPMEGSHAGALHEELQPTGRAHVGRICRGPSPHPEEEAVAESTRDELTAAPIVHLPTLLH